MNGCLHHVHLSRAAAEQVLQGKTIKSEVSQRDSPVSFHLLNMPSYHTCGQFIGRPQTFVELQLRFKLHFLSVKMLIIC